MEDTLRAAIDYHLLVLVAVLILVLMEDTLRDVAKGWDQAIEGKILILVLMEDTLRVMSVKNKSIALIES